ATREAFIVLERLIDELEDVELLTAEDDELLLELELLVLEVTASKFVDNIQSEVTLKIIIILIIFNTLYFTHSPLTL
uniref:hypothetical protein n=1 Tax=Paenibacillus terrae TaxID=159743 RepID=UPI001C92C6C3